MSRTEKTFRCKKDGRAIARIEIEDQQRWLVRVAARDGHLRSLQSDLDAASESWRDGRETIVREHGEEFYSRALGRLLNPEVCTSGQRQLLPSDLDVLNQRLGHDPQDYTAPCPKCHTPYALSVVARDNGTYGVVVSNA